MNTAPVLKMNESAMDRALRFGVGLVLIALAFIGEIGPWGYLGAVPLVTAIVGYCPLYALLGISTAGKRTAHQSSPRG
jgi:hypothetical protein